ncbi:DNA repair protein RadC [Paucilactobacillus suebicus]|uniref:DNA repair protein n=1 Tax=Paucilactobacillus suebicus DSM 5007 = KCTC 3549 TaxID=1423807 RepID=A0A0R1W712_9LACO|nr:DNA repair protein RadC [Paucilactobacillus suebicus]KRM13482.1 DNA repair protein [Paucilactobacillus suebicus DSM 5007 = KCTC 3549]
MNETINFKSMSDQLVVKKFFKAAYPGEEEKLSDCFWNSFADLGEFKTANTQERLAVAEKWPTELQQLMLGIEIGRRVCKASRPILGHIYSSSQLGQILVDEFQDDYQENLCLFCLNVRHMIVRQQVVFRGTLTTCPVHPREIFAEAIEAHAESIIIAHNHPSGMTKPSENDIEFTKRLVECGELLGIEVLDSFVVGDKDYLSMKESKML